MNLLRNAAMDYSSVPMEQLNVEKLAKLMQLTTSDNDHEALSALRMANKMLAAQKKTWQQMLVGGGAANAGSARQTREEPPKREKPREEPRGQGDRKAWPSNMDKFRLVMEYEPENTFIISLHEFFTEFGYLSDKQQFYLDKYYRKWSGI